jgi:uncharacterized membrane protein
MQQGRALVYLYCIGASVFFGACAFAQSNDPDPELWVAGYLVAGCLLNFLVLLTGTKTYRTVLWLSLGTASIIAVCLAWWTLVLLPKLHYSPLFNLDIKAFAWSILEFEEGREIGGLLILLLHVLKLLDFQRDQTTNEPKSTDKTSPGIPYSTLAALLVIVGAVYLWVMYQPQMNMRENMEHCAGVFQNTYFVRSAASSHEEL